jgi:hypothetical protein
MFKTGDKVQWMRTVSSGNRMRFTTCFGRITNISPFGAATVKLRNGRSERVPLRDLQRDGDKSQLTEMVETMTMRCNSCHDLIPKGSTSCDRCGASDVEP